MPFVRWQVQPTGVGRVPPPPSQDVGGDPLEWTTNGTLVAVLRQLASVARCADHVFDDVAAELFEVHARCKALSSRVVRLENAAKVLDAKKVCVPLSDLTTFSHIRDHFTSKQLLDDNLFPENSRPLCVEVLYNNSLVSPVHIMREIDPLRQDGRRTSKYFMCTPVLGDDKKRQSNIDLEIELRRPSSVCVVRDTINEDDTLMESNEADNDDDSCSSTALLRLPLPEERTHALSLKYPYNEIAIDVTGSGFRRMASFRRSLIQHVEFLTRKKKKKKNKSDRRNTISDTDDIKIALGNQKNETILSKARKRFSMAESSGACKENLFKQVYNSLRKPSESKSVQTGEETASEKSFDSRSSHRRSFNYHTLPRSKELRNEVDIENSECETKERKSKNKARKSLIPISTLSQAMSVAVKMRDSTTRNSKKEDSGQSSSGNWSASSSTRTSVESEKIQNAFLDKRVPSQTSLSKDSALSDQTSPYDDMPSSYDSYQSDISAANSSSFKKPKNSNKSTLKSRQTRTRELKDEERLYANGDATDETSTTGTLTPLLGSRALSPFDMPMAFMDDEESSVYSVDTDGYYTSMHTDSGLRSMSSSTKPLDKDSNSSNDNSNDNSSTLSSVSSLEHTDNDDKNNRHSTGTIKLKKMPPQPPKRNSSLGQNDSGSPSKELEDSKNSSPYKETHEKPPYRLCSSPTSESDAEVQETFRRKTVMNTSRIPSMCVVTPNPSDEEEENEKVEYQDKLKLPVTKDRKLVEEDSLHKESDLEVDFSDIAFRTVPRNFERRTTGTAATKFSTHSWPRSVTNTGLSSSPRYMSVNSDIPKLTSFTPNKHPILSKPASDDQSSDSSTIPLKYVQHITITPGGKCLPSSSNSCKGQIKAEEQSMQNSGSLERKQSSASPLEKKVIEVPQQSKVIYATNSLERKNRPGARVTLDPSGKVLVNQTNIYDVPSVDNKPIPIQRNGYLSSGNIGAQQLNRTSSPAKFQSNIPQAINSATGPDKITKTTNSDGAMQKANDEISIHQNRPLFKSYSFRGVSNTLPRMKSYAESSPPSLNLPRNTTSSTFPRSHDAAKQQSVGSSSSSIDSQSSKGSPSSAKLSMPALPPPMSLMSPSKSQATRRWSYTSYGLSPSSKSNYNNNNNEAQLNIPTMLRSSNVNNNASDPPKPVSTVLTNPSPAIKYSSTTLTPNINTVGLPVSSAPPVYSWPSVPNTSEVGRENMYSSIKQSMSYSQPNANYVPGNQRAIPTYSKSSAPPQSNRMTPPYVNPPGVQNRRPSTPNMCTPPPPPPSRQYRLIQQNNSLESPTDVPQYSIMRASTPVNSTVSMAPRRLEWSMNTPVSKGANVCNSFSNQNGLGDKVNGPYTSNGYGVPAYEEPLRRKTSDPPMERGLNGVVQRSASDRLMNQKGKEIKSSSMSANDLFAVIHQSKKRLNMKTSNSETSISPISSRSASPALSVCSQPSRPSGPETGMFSPRTLPGDRRSWAGDPSSPIRNGTATLPGDRRSWAIDRLGPSKPTTMHDFKMLLLQAGRSGNVQEPTVRRSASDMLKLNVPKQEEFASDRIHQMFDRSTTASSPVSRITPSNYEHTYDAPTNTTPPRNVRQSWSLINQNSPSQYGRGRMRTPFHTRTDILSMPIIEDNLEDELASEEKDKNQRYMEMSTDFANASRKFPMYRQNGLYKFTEKNV